MFRIDRKNNIRVCEGFSVWGYRWKIDDCFADTESFHIVQNDIDKEIVSVNISIAGLDGCHMIMSSHDTLNITSKLLNKLKKIVDDNPETKTKEIECIIKKCRMGSRCY